MFQHLLLPIDGSATAQAALEKALALTKAFGSKITCIYVIDPYPFTGVGTDLGFGQEQYQQAAQTDARIAMSEANEKFTQAGITPQTRIVQAHAVWRGIIDTARDVHADLIVIGSHGRRGLEKLVLGSVAQTVLAHTRISTLVVRLDEPEAK